MNTPGKLVRVNDVSIHVFQPPGMQTEKQGVIVFLAGSGTECPTYDFKPLWKLLETHFHFAVVERPGYGWSGQTDSPRDISTVLEETREALRLAGAEGPYIPAPHSLSGLEAIYWAQKYPEEVLAIVGLDMVVPQVYRSLKLPKSLSIQASLAHLLRRPAAGIMVKSHPAAKSGLLTTEEQEEMRRIVSGQLLSKNMLDEIAYVKEKARTVAEGKSPRVPLLCFLSNDKGNLKRIPDWGKAQREYFADNSRAEFVELSCGHYVHREAPETIAHAILGFLGG